MGQNTSKRRANNLQNMRACLPSLYGLSVHPSDIPTPPCTCGHARIRSHGRYGTKKCQVYECPCKRYVKPPPTQQEVDRVRSREARIIAHMERIAWMREWGAGVGDADDDPLVG